MLLKSIKLTNFRQFIDEQITFADGSDGKNVTIILGENGTGKTTFAQAFFWCMYGETEFSDKMMLNRHVANRLLAGQTAVVSVVLKLTHGDNAYTLTRQQTYTKEASGNIKASNTVFDILRRDRSGNTTTIKPTLRESEVYSILPKEISRYFFFDGERIERMSKDISSHKKATDFADAVRSLLGLKGMESAIKHLNPGSKTSVVGVYEASYDPRSNATIAELTRTINECKDTIARIDSRIEELDKQIELARVRREQKIGELKQYEDGEKLQKQKEELERSIAAAKKSRSNMIKVICSSFSANSGSFFSAWMIQKAMLILRDKDFTGKDIPHMHGDTIEYLLKQGVCICGTHLTEGSIPYEKVHSLIDLLPPKSLSSNISDFKKASTRRVSAFQQTDLIEFVAENLSVISQQDDDITNYTEDLHAIEGKLSGSDVRDKVRSINAEIQQCEVIIASSNLERDKKLGERGDAIGQMERADSRRGQLALLDEKNKKIEIYKDYAERIYRELVEFYNRSEAEVRCRLQETINDIFKQIYEGGLSLTIDEKYHISVYAEDYAGGVETSTAQSISVIFAFIAGIIKMARENRNAESEEEKILSSEPYPLVMDAPLSAFDKRRIKTVCTALPEVAEQVVIFIKDTDGDLAEEHMGERIGSRHRFDKLNEFETKLV